MRVRIGRGTLTGEALSGSTVVAAAESRFGTPEELTETLAALRGEMGCDTGSACEVEVEPPLMQRRTLQSLPPVSPRALEELVDLHAARFLRRNGKPLVTGARWLSRPRPWRRSASAVAEIAGIELPWLDAIVEGVRSAGLELERVGPTASRMHVQSPIERRRTRARDLTILRRLGAFAIAAWVAAAATHVGRMMYADRELSRALRRMQTPAAAVRSARRAVGDAERMIDAVARSERERGHALARLAAVVAALPDSAYLTSASIYPAGGEAVGAGRRAASGGWAPWSVRLAERRP